MPTDYFSQVFSEFVERALTSKGETQKQLAGEIGLDRTQLNRLLNSRGAMRWTPESMRKAAKRFDISLDEVRREADGREEGPSGTTPLSAQFRSVASVENQLAKLVRLYRLVRPLSKSGKMHEAFSELIHVLGRDHPVLFTSCDRQALDLVAETLELFFETPWQKPLKELRPDQSAVLLHWAGCTLRAQGRLSDAADAMSAGFALSQGGMDRLRPAHGWCADKERVWQGAVMGCINLSTLWLFRGDLTAAMKWAKTGGDFDGDAAARAALVDACRTIHRYLAYLHDPADPVAQPDPPPSDEEYAKVEERFRFVRELRRYFADRFSLARGDHGAVAARHAGRLDLGRAELEDSGLAPMSLGMALALAGETGDAAAWLDEAVAGLARAGERHHLPAALLARADVSRERGDCSAAASDINEALAIAIPDKMRLYHIDATVTEARVEFDRGKPEEAARLLDLAESSIRDETTGYGLGQKAINSLRTKLPA